MPLDDFVKSRQGSRHSKKLHMQGARILRNEAYIEVRCNDERWSTTPQMDFLRSRPLRIWATRLGKWLHMPTRPNQNRTWEPARA